MDTIIKPKPAEPSATKWLQLGPAMVGGGSVVDPKQANRLARFKHYASFTPIVAFSGGVTWLLFHPEVLTWLENAASKLL